MRNSTFRLFSAFFWLLFSPLLLLAQTGGGLLLVSEGRTDYQIVLPDAATPVQQTAASELQKYLEAISEVKIPIVSESQAQPERRIVIGPSPLSRHLLGGSFDESSIGYDGIALQTVGSDLILTGHAQRGMLYSVYSLLEDVLGCRFWASDCETIPHRSSIQVSGDLSVRFTPRLIYRDAHYTISKNGPFAAKCKLNGTSPIPSEFGGHHEFCHFVHSFYPLIPPSKYFEAHPEWFSEVDGKRTCDHAQLCLTNEEMTQEFIRNVLRDLRANPEATFISVSQNDWHQNYCHCANCMKIAEEEGSQSGPLIRFVNRVAEAVEKEFPHVYVETLAYTYTRKPPKIVRPRKNVVVRLCTIECSFSQPLSGEQNQKLREDLDGWSKIAPNLFIWDYVTNFSFYLLPHPNYGVLRANINFFVDHHAIGLFEQGDAHSQAGDFVPLRNWVLSKILWDPSLDFDQLKDEFVAGYYGPEFVSILDSYFKILRSEVEKSEIYLGIYRNTTKDWLSFEGLNEATRLMNEAQKLAEELEARDPARYAGLTAKIRHDRIPMDLVWLKDYVFYRSAARFTPVSWQGPQDGVTGIDDFLAKLEEFKVTRFRESKGEIQLLKDELLQTRETLSRMKGHESADVPESCRDLPAQCWLEVQEDQFHIHKPGECAFIEEDSAASNGISVRMGGDHTQWATAWPIPKLVEKMKPVPESNPDPESDSGSVAGSDSGAVSGTVPPRYRVLAFVRCDATGAQGTAMTLGVYDEHQKKNLSSRSPSISAISGEGFHLIDLGEMEFGPGQYFWAAPVNRPGEVQSVFTDRLILIRTK